MHHGAVPTSLTHLSTSGHARVAAALRKMLDIFGHWTDMVTDLIRATPEEDVLRRDIFDRPPIFKWTQVPPLRAR